MQEEGSGLNKAELNKLIKGCYEAGASDPYDVADTVMLMLSKEDYEEALRAALPMYVRVISGRYRKRPDSKSRPVFVPSSGWKDMSELTANECREVADQYRKLAAQNAAMADEFEEWGSKLDISGKHVLGDLAEYKEYHIARTKEGMSKAKAAGRRVGRPGAPVDLILRIRKMRENMTLKSVAAVLNEEGLKTPQGSIWTETTAYKCSLGRGTDIEIKQTRQRGPKKKVAN